MTIRRKLDPGPLRLGAAAGMTLALLAGCGSVPKESFYTLAAPPMEAASASAVSVYVGLAALPEAVDRNPMVVRTGPNQVDIDDFHRWAEPLKSAIPRVLAANLARELGGARVSSGRGGSATGADYRVAVDISRFDSSFAEGAALEAAWTITAKSGAPAQGRTVARAPAPSADHAGVAAAHSQALAQLAREIAAAISRRPSSPAPSARGG
jgi:uncharacterized lipoprotein YmbA